MQNAWQTKLGRKKCLQKCALCGICWHNNELGQFACINIHLPLNHLGSMFNHFVQFAIANFCLPLDRGLSLISISYLRKSHSQAGSTTYHLPEADWSILIAEHTLSSVSPLISYFFSTSWESEICTCIPCLVLFIIFNFPPVNVAFIEMMLIKRNGCWNIEIRYYVHLGKGRLVFNLIPPTPPKEIGPT